MMLDDELKSKLADITKIFEKKIELVVIKGEESEETQDMIEMVQDIASTSEKIFVKIFEKESLELKDKGINLEKLPAVVILDENGEFSRIKYIAVPTGQELNSFILAMYNVAGPGQKINESIIERIKKIDKKLDLKRKWDNLNIKKFYFEDIFNSPDEIINIINYYLYWYKG